jgi:hypothetical protein
VIIPGKWDTCSPFYHVVICNQRSPNEKDGFEILWRKLRPYSTLILQKKYWILNKMPISINGTGKYFFYIAKAKLNKSFLTYLFNTYSTQLSSCIQTRRAVQCDP